MNVKVKVKDEGDSMHACCRYVFLAVYSAEAIIKLVARGFIIDSNTYLRDGWNWLDFGIVVLSYVELDGLNYENFTYLIEY